jgi:uncharacterized protein YoxC
MGRLFKAQVLGQLQHLITVTARLEAALNQLKTQGVENMATIDQIVAAVHDETTVVAGINTLLTALQAKITELAGGAISPEVQAKIDSAFAEITANNTALASAITANTPPA